MRRKIIIGTGCFFLACITCWGGARIEENPEAGLCFSQQGTRRDSLPATDVWQMEFFYCSDSDRVAFDAYLNYIKPYCNEPVSEVVIRTARYFLNKPYVASTLEIAPEGLVVNLRTFDCTTFVETVLALSQTVKRYEQPTFDNFCRLLQNTRYRRGFIKDYTSRLHYFSDWIYENENRAHVKDVTSILGGVPYQVNLHFMSSHPAHYKQLTTHPEYVDVLREKEKEISERTLYSLIPQSEIGLSEPKMQNGDILCFVTNIEGLDVSHVGFFYRDEGRCTFIHASSAAKKVIVQPQTLQTYVERNQKNIGLMVVRPCFSE